MGSLDVGSASPGGGMDNSILETQNWIIGISGMSEDHYRRLENMYLAAPCNEIYRPRVTITEGSAEIIFDVGPHLFHAGRAVHGSAYFKAMDDAAFFAVNSLVEDVFVLTVTFNIYLLRPISEGEMAATGTIVSAGRTLWVAEATLSDDRGRQLGRGSGTFMRSRHALSETMGYNGKD
jgi:uncharacterized protein (TIGR00369 family)